MATLKELTGEGRPIDRIELELDGALPHRFLYGTVKFGEWMTNTLPGLETGRLQADVTPYEQVFARFRQFIVGDNLRSDRRFAPLVRDPDTFVWELKTVDVRIFGWFPKMDHFICCFGGFADAIKDLHLYTPLIQQVEYARKHLPLDDPKSIEFREYENVLSDAD